MSAGSTDSVKPRTVGDAAYLHTEKCPRSNPEAPVWTLCGCRNEVPMPADAQPSTSAHDLTGRQVVVTLGTEDGSPVVARGKLLAHNEWGEVVLQDDMGGLQFCWPNLAITLDHDPTAQGDWP